MSRRRLVLVLRAGIVAGSLASCATVSERAGVPSRVPPVAAAPPSATDPPPATVPPPPVEQPARASSLPPIPFVDGELALDVGYPREELEITTRGQNFIFGSAGSGLARVTINGQAVEVAPNGGFLAFLPVPVDGVYRLVAEKDGERVSMERTVLLPPATVATPPPAETAIYRGSAFPTGTLAAFDGEPLAVGFRGTPGGRSWIVLPGGERIPLVASGSRYEGTLPARPLSTPDTGVDWPSLGSLDPTVGGAYFELVVGSDTVRSSFALNLSILASDRPRIAVTSAPADALPNWRARGRNDVAGAYYYFWPEGARLSVTGQRGSMLRVRLAEGRTAWIPLEEVEIQPEGILPELVIAGDSRVYPEAEYLDIRVPLGQRVPYQVVVEDRRIHLDVFGAVARTNRLAYGPLDPLLRQVQWSQPSDGVFRVTAELNLPVWGYDAFFDENGAVVLRIRRPPTIEESNPLRGLRVVVDAGHGGADRDTRGPTGFTEADANLEVALALGDLLVEGGADVFYTRATDSTVDLVDRTWVALESDGHLLVSIHSNAFPDGVDPWPNHGTSVYYYHPQSADLARLLQRELIAEMGTRDLGVVWADLALARPTWMPAVLTESLFMMIPQHEAALLNPETRERIARAHLRAIEAFVSEFTDR